MRFFLVLIWGFCWSSIASAQTFANLKCTNFENIDAETEDKTCTQDCDGWKDAQPYETIELTISEEAKQRDHRFLGSEIRCFGDGCDKAEYEITRRGLLTIEARYKTWGKPARILLTGKPCIRNADETFFGTVRLSEREKEIASLNGNLPVGSIVAWLSRPGVGIPENWAIADGRLITDNDAPAFNGRRLPNLNNARFLMGTLVAHDLSGGSNTITFEEEHNHGGKTGSAGGHRHTATIGSRGAHQHSGTTSVVGVGRRRVDNDTSDPHALSSSHSHSFQTNAEGGHSHPSTLSFESSHDHSIATKDGHNHGGDNRPSWYGVIYLIKIK